MTVSSPPWAPPPRVRTPGVGTAMARGAAWTAALFALVGGLLGTLQFPLVGTAAVGIAAGFAGAVLGWLNGGLVAVCGGRRLLLGVTATRLTTRLARSAAALAITGATAGALVGVVLGVRHWPTLPFAIVEAAVIGCLAAATLSLPLCLLWLAVRSMRDQRVG